MSLFDIRTWIPGERWTAANVNDFEGRVDDAVAAVVDRASHEGQQLAETISDFTPAKSVVPPNERTSNYTLVLGDAGKVVEMDTIAASTVTVPAAAGFAIGTTIEIERVGDATCTITPASGVTVGSLSAGLSIKGPGGIARLRYKGDDVWHASGDLEVGGLPGGPGKPKLRHPDPALWNPVTIQVQATGVPTLGVHGTNFTTSTSGGTYAINLESGQDYIIEGPSTYRTQNLRLNGGAKVKIVGLGMRPVTGGLWITNTQEVAYLEGCDVDQINLGSPADALQYYGRGRIYVQNSRFRNVISTDASHGDAWQSIYAGGIHGDRITMTTEGQGLFARPDGSLSTLGPQTGPIVLSNIDGFHSDSLNPNFITDGGGDIFWFTNSGSYGSTNGPNDTNWGQRHAEQIHLDNCWAASDELTDIVYPWSGQALTPTNLESTVDSASGTVTLNPAGFVRPAVDKSGFIKIGRPAASFVKDEDCGPAYISPGYQATETSGADMAFSTRPNVRWKHYLDDSLTDRAIFVATETASNNAVTSVTCSLDGGAPVAMTKVATERSATATGSRRVEWYQLTGVTGEVAEIIATWVTSQNCAAQSWHLDNVHQSKPVRLSSGTTLGGADTGSGTATSLTATALGYPDSSMSEETGTRCVLVAAGVRLTQGNTLTTRSCTSPAGNGIPAGEIRPDQNRQMGGSAPRNNRVFFGRCEAKADDSAVAVTLGWSGADTAVMQLLPVRKATA